jgi:hypothetical protein
LNPESQNFDEMNGMCDLFTSDLDDDDLEDEYLPTKSPQKLFPPSFVPVKLVRYHRNRNVHHGIDFNDSERTVLEDTWKNALAQSTSRFEGLNTTVQLQSINLSRDAGFFRWTDQSGSKIETIRNLIDEVKEELFKSTEIIPAQTQQLFKRPGIIHSTFLRFKQLPPENWESLWDSAISTIKDSEFFKLEFSSADIIVENLHLVGETAPYMYRSAVTPNELLQISLSQK